MKNKILLIPALSEHITELRKPKGNASEVAEKIGKSTGWLSMLENCKLSTVNSKDLINVFAYLLSISNQEAEEYIENFLQEQKQQFKKQEGIIFYDEDDEEYTQEGFKKITDNILHIFNHVFTEEPKFAFFSIGDFMQNLQSDVGFILALNRISFHKLENTDVKIKKQLFKEINEVAKKYIAEYGEKENEEPSKLDDQQ